MSGGIKLGRVVDVLIDVDAMSMSALLVAGDSGRGGLPYANIIAIGPDAITVQDPESVFWASATNPGPGRESNEIKGLDVVNRGGEVIGSVHDFELEGAEIKSIEVRSGGVFGIGAIDSTISKECIQSIGPNLVTIESDHKAAHV